MIFDIHTSLGHWPFRRVPDHNPAELRILLEESQINRAAVTNTHGLFYKNCHDANLELAEWIAPHNDFFAGVATLNPMYAALERDLVDCVQSLGFCALRLAPQYHDYSLNSPHAIEITGAASEIGLALFIPHRVVDTRQRHWFDTERVIDIVEVGALCEAVPQARIIVTESKYPVTALIDDNGLPRYPGLYLESSRVTIDALPESYAASQILFGSGTPFKHITPARLKVDTSDLSPNVKSRIYAGNAKALLKF